MESLGKSQGQAPREYHTQCYVVEVQTLVELNPNILVRHVERMKVRNILITIFFTPLPTPSPLLWKNLMSLTSLSSSLVPLASLPSYLRRSMVHSRRRGLVFFRFEGILY